MFNESSTVAPNLEAPSPSASVVAAEDPLAKMGYSHVSEAPLPDMPAAEEVKDPLQNMGYDRVVPADGGEVPPIDSATATGAPENGDPSPDSTAPEANESYESLQARVATLEAQIANLTKPGEGSEKFNKMMHQFGVNVGTKIAALEKFYQNQLDKSPLVKFYRRMQRGVEVLKAGKQGFDDAVKAYIAEENAKMATDPGAGGKFGTPEAAQATPTAEVAEADPAIPEMKATPDVEAKTETEPVTEVAPQAVAAEKSATPENPFDADKLRMSYEKLLEKPDVMDIITKVEEFSTKHGHTDESLKEVLGELLKDEPEMLEAWNTLHEKPGALEYMKELKDLGVSPEKANKLILEKFGPKDEQSSGDEEEATIVSEEVVGEAQPVTADNPSGLNNEPITVTKEAPRTGEVQTQVEQAQSLTEAQRQEVRRREMRELIGSHQGRSESDLSIREQIRLHSAEYNNLEIMAAKEPAEKLASRPQRSEDSRTEDGKDIKANVTAEYEGDIDSPGALDSAKADQALKMDIKRQLLEAQSGDNANVEDQLDLFRFKVGEMLGDTDLVELNRGDLKKFVPGETDLIISYEQGKVRLTVRPLDTDAQGAPRPNNAFDTSFRFKKP